MVHYDRLLVGKPKKEEQEFDVINRPKHYAYSEIEPIDVIEAWNLNYSMGCAMKYVARHKHKGSPIEDLQKANWYITREIERLQRSPSNNHDAAVPEHLRTDG